MILQRYILRELLVTFVLAFAAIASVCAIGVIFQTFRAYEGMTLGFILRLGPVAITQMSPWAMIVSSCLSATLVYGRLAADNEIDAIRTSGIHVNRILVPAFFFGLLLSTAAFVIHGEAAPRARYARRSLIKETLYMVLRHPPSGRQNELKIGGRNRLSYLDCNEGTLDHPALLILKEGKPHLLCFAREGRITVPEDGAPSITLLDASLTEFNTKLPLEHSARIRAEGRYEDRQTVPFELEDIYRRTRGPADMPAGELEEHLGRVQAGRPLREALTEWNGRMARSLAPLVLVLLCAPVGIFVKKGSRLAGMGVALPPILVYIVLMIVGEGLGAKERLDPVVATYGPVALLALVAAILLVKVYRR